MVPLLRYRRLKALLGLWHQGPGVLGKEAKEVLCALRKAEASDSPFRERLQALLARRQVEELLPEALEAAKEAGRVQRRARRANWRDYCQEQMECGAGRLFKWVRNGSMVQPLPMCPAAYDAEAGGPAPGLQSRLEAVEGAWWTFWGAEDLGAEGFSKWEGPHEGPPPFPPLLKLTGPILHSALQR